MYTHTHTHLVSYWIFVCVSWFPPFTCSWAFSFKHFKALSVQPRTTADARSGQSLSKSHIFLCTDALVSDCFGGVFSSAAEYNLPITNSCRAAFWLAAPTAAGSQWAQVMKIQNQWGECSQICFLNWAPGEAGKHTHTRKKTEERRTKVVTVWLREHFMTMMTAARCFQWTYLEAWA